MDKKILIINAGSSSIKYKVFLQKDYSVIASGLCERIGLKMGCFKLKATQKSKPINFEKDVKIPTHDVGIDIILKYLKEFKIINNLNEIVGIGHRVVQVGTKYNDSHIVDAECIKQIEHCTPLAPLHNPSELKVIKIFKQKLPKVINVAAFDTSFHSTIPAINHIYPLNDQISKKYEIRRYGYHGVSYKFITLRMQKILKKKSVNLIVCHIGNGASICAIKDSKSFNTSMGLTPLEGLMMGTRCGDIDPSIAPYLMRKGMNDKQIDDLFNKQSGLYGFVGSGDVRDAYSEATKGNKKAKFALDLYTNVIARYIIRYANELEGKIDAIVFTAGVGENQNYVVDTSCKKVKLFNLSLDPKKLTAKYSDYIQLNTIKSKYKVFRVRTDEELMIAQDVARLSK